MVTVFTPTYNRAYILPQLYESLCRQTSKNFEWLVVDDGSTDNTEELFKVFVAEQKIVVRYYKHPNGGKHRAINAGVKLAEGELFFIVDSDDYLTNDAVAWIESRYADIRGDETFAGLSGFRQTSSGERIGGELSFDYLDCSALDLRMRYHVAGDMAEIYRRDVLREFPFDEIEDEKFCPEALVWNRIALRYKVRWINYGIYVCEYLPDGLTARITRIRMKSPQSAKRYYAELYRMPIPFMQRVKAAINFWRFALCANVSFGENLRQVGLSAMLWAPLGIVIHIIDLRR
ncbi:MAG: glycosyltransferase family 2 protein [Alistipes sp.]|nr:glycosyltransferase family 2 protein [Alistipes sp.]